MSRTHKDYNYFDIGASRLVNEARKRVANDSTFAALLGFHADQDAPQDPDSQLADHVKHILNRGQ